MNRGFKLWNDKEITTTLTAPGIVRTALGRVIWSTILGKTSVTNVVNKGDCFKTERCSTGNQYNF